MGYGVQVQYNIDEKKYFNIEYIKNLVTTYYSLGFQDRAPNGLQQSLAPLLSTQDLYNIHTITINYVDMSGSLIKSISLQRKLNVNFYAPNETIIQVKFKNDISCIFTAYDFKLSNGSRNPAFLSPTAINDNNLSYEVKFEIPLRFGQKSQPE